VNYVYDCAINSFKEVRHSSVNSTVLSWSQRVHEKSGNSLIFCNCSQNQSYNIIAALFYSFILMQ